MRYKYIAIPEDQIPRATLPQLQHLLEIYGGEINKVISIWSEFRDSDLDFKPHPRSSSVGEIFKHQLLSERRFFGEFLSTPEPEPDRVLPIELSVRSCCARLVELASPR